MKTGHGGRLSLALCFVAVVGVFLAARSGHSQPFEYVITFDQVVVRGIDSLDTPELAHRDLPRPDTSLAPAQAGADRAKQREGIAGPSPRGGAVGGGKPKGSGSGAPPPREDSIAGLPPKTLSNRTPGSPFKFEPGKGTENPSFVQAGFLVEAFWAAKIGTSEGLFKRAHFHPPDLSSGFEAQHLGNPDELHGIYIRSLDGKRFGVKSLKYRVTRNRQLPAKPLSIEGFTTFNVSVLIARSFDPQTPIRVQFVTLPIGLPVGNDLTLPWWTLRIFGFQLVNQVYIASSGSVDFDDIVLTRSEPPSVAPDRQEQDGSPPSPVPR
jgi:hypothetical protein